eukprot:COSAG05_NODE_24_length_31553_cov_12.138647_15_plen_66_part_00
MVGGLFLYGCAHHTTAVTIAAVVRYRYSCRLALHLLDQIRSEIHTRTQAYTRKTPKEIRTGTPIG